MSIGRATDVPRTQALRSPSAVIDYARMEPFLRHLANPVVGPALVALALTGLLYGDTLALPLFSDDLIQIPWLESLSWRELWSGPSPYGYYRPLWYSLWRVWGLLTGGLRPMGLHLLNLVAHFAAAWLAGLLSSAWIRPNPSCEAHGDPARRTLAACLATALFATYPFSRQAVAWPGAIYNQVVSAMAAGAVLAYDRGRRNGHTAWIFLGMLLAMLAPFFYEAGLLVGPAVVLAEGVGSLCRRWRRRVSWWPLAFIGIFGVTALVWRSMRGAGAAGLGLGAPDVRRNASYLVQGLTFPIAPLGQVLSTRLALDPELALWIVALPVLAILTWRGLQQNRSAFLLGAGWFVLFSLPPVVSMKADWFALAPRFLYMTAAGVALVWTTAAGYWTGPAGAGEHRRLPRPRQPVAADPSAPLAGERGPEHAQRRSRGFSRHAVVVVLVLIGLLAPGIAFVRDGMRLYNMAGQAIWEAANAARRDRPILLVNLPLRITPHRRTYPLGFEGITPLPNRVTAEGLVYVHTAIRRAARAVSFGIVATDEPAGYTYRLFGQQVGWEELADAVRQARTVHLTYFEPEQIHLVEAGGPADEASPRVEPLARFKNQVALLDAATTCDMDGHVRLTGYWRSEAAIDTDVTIFAHLLAPDGSLVAQADGYPLLGMLPFWLWWPGETIRDVRYFDASLAAEHAHGYQVRVGMWELATGEHWPAEGHPDGTILLTVECR